MKHNKNKTQKNENFSNSIKKKPYTKPQLTNFGHVEKLTQGGGGTSVDKQGTRSRP